MAKHYNLSHTDLIELLRIVLSVKEVPHMSDLESRLTDLLSHAQSTEGLLRATGFLALADEQDHIIGQLPHSKL